MESNVDQSNTETHVTDHGDHYENAENASMPVRGKSDVVFVNTEEIEEAENDPDEANKQSGEAVRKLLLANSSSNSNPTAGNEERKKTAEEIAEEELLADLAKRPLSYFKNMKNVPDSIAKIHYKDIERRWNESEVRIKETEDLLGSIKYEDRSLEEDRLEILGELLDKASQSFEIYEEHEVHKVPYGHRIVLEIKLLTVFNDAIDLIFKIIGEFDKLKGDQIGANDERDQLRYEIRYCDAVYTEVHERFLKSYLEMEW